MKEKQTTHIRAEISDKNTLLSGQECPMCKEKTLTLRESESEVPYFGKVFLFSMTCDNCKYHKADIESAETREPAKFEIEINSEEDMKIRVVRSSAATLKIPHVTTVTPGPASQGYVTNIEGVLKRVRHEIESLREMEEDDDSKRKAKNLIKKLNNVMWGRDKLKLIIEDPTGNSAIISDKAVKSKLGKARQPLPA
ncbi:MAG: zinc finger protein [archaeon GW2011_AR3]|nr:MAG: zinc finger protein [archaeon GW2011_AR3]MBS3109013.1 ZPR1 zinc finger domain-containing protein [Candidatus Woesearchaeota archaeon]